MARDNSVRKLFNKLIGKNAANDMSRLNYEISFEERYRAGTPPIDNSVVEDFHGVKVSDPFRPLENLDSFGTQTWTKKQQEKFAKYIEDSASSVKATTDFLTDALNYDSYSLANRYGDIYIRNFHKALAAQSTIETATSPDGPWKTLLDPNTLSEDGTVALNGSYVSRDGKLMAYLTSNSGSDASTLRIRDIETGKDLPDVIENCRFTSVLWDKDSHAGFQYTYPTHDESRRRMIKHHFIGTATECDAQVFAPDTDNTSASPSRFDTAKYEWIYKGVGTDKNHGLLFRPFGSTADFKEIVAPRTYSLSPCAELEDGSVLAITTKDAPRGKLVKFNPQDPAPEKWATIIPESATDVLEGSKLHQGKLFAFYTHDTADVVFVFTPEGKHLHNVPLPPQSVTSYGRILPEDDKFRLRIAGFQSAGDTYEYDIAKNELTLTEKSPAKIDLRDCIVERLFATSKDGTKVPMTVIRGADTVLDGTAAVKLYGYGGFNVPLPPSFSSTLAHFVKSGGIYVQTNLRGGGEFGQEWYDQGRLHNKQNVFDDFIACAEHLVQKKYTSPKRLVINGGSNGGLLTSATMLQRPDLFGAVITQVPVTDMFRYHLATYGAYWKSDYGDPAIKADFEAAAQYSPLHNVQPGAKYPPHLIMTADHDDRVVPWHAFKLAATLQARTLTENVTLLRVAYKAGHGAGKPLAKTIEDYAESFAFIEKAIGPVNQKAYKQTLVLKAAEKKATKAAKRSELRKKAKAIFTFGRRK